jgi:hypothetical protein
MYEKIQNGYYSTKVPYPHRPDSDTKHLPGVWAQYQEQRDAYEADQQRLNSEFEDDLAAEFGVTDNPKRHVLYGIAWDRGHSGGYSEVYGVYADLVDLIK